MKYDAAIIGAGANGLTAAAALARAGLRVVVVDRAPCAGGRLVTDNFHPGFRASPFADRVPEIPGEIAASLELDGGLHVEDLPEDLRLRRDAALARIFAEAREPHHHGLLARLRRAMAPPPAVWPGADLAVRPLTSWPSLTAWALMGRATDPELAGSALTLLALPGAEPLKGGLGALGQSFMAAAAGADFQLSQEAGEVAVERGRVTGLILADGSRLEAEAVISTLDLKHSTLSLFPWAMLPPAMAARAAQFRMGGGAARLLLALNRPLASVTPLLLPGDDDARAAFRRGVAPAEPPLLLDPVSARDASLAPDGGATVTVTMACIPARLFDGAWTHERRLRLAAGVLARIERALPGFGAALTGLRIITPTDMEERLGVTDGDLDGGQLAPDQMLGQRPGTRTMLRGFYLGGASTAAGPLGTGAAGYAAALALLADRGARP